uniref:Uncharacterized protein n=1 Tax=Anguilla anguilla TaxID=7936 RepID=A0A0E9Q5U0_ANGAN
MSNKPVLTVLSMLNRNASQQGNNKHSDQPRG